ncbi:phosphatidylinositol mannoside acyltransferase [Williamsia serinedens]|uniref:KDO2-lipid IV(A) lauroyltransferase n=1 Tax=Williamsia serinedens TaxID=391736 RepID=A0ABT1GWJ8_9NOCA|nr:phosphatidylinositol mannoside acyltransferase [Williamsia serinedens]MCP2159129.1 KDO2-lipid IV(A) lauroyltransferase [Williamsia serinedens]
MSLAERAADLGYGAGWSVVRRLPEPWVRAVFDAAGGRAGAKGGPEQLRRNLSRVLGVDAAEVPDDLMRAATRSYTRYWREAFRLPSMDFAQAASRVHVAPQDLANFEEAYARGKGVVFALPHSGNWDMAGVWLVNRIGGFSTVAERLKPESLFERFVAYRESLGFEIFPLSGGEQPPFGQLAERLRAGRVVCLLAERDLAEHGVPVTFFGEPTRMPAGPAKLAIETGAALLPVHHWFTDTHGSQISCDPPVDVSGGLQAATQAMADVFARNIAAHPQDWHMLQPLWEADWSRGRRERLGVTGEDGAP